MIVTSNTPLHPVPVMDRQTVRFPIAAGPLDLESNPEAGEENPNQTVVLSGIPAKDAGNSALAQLDALSSLVHREARENGDAPSEPSDGPEESLDDYMKQFMERMTGKKVEVVSPVQTVQPAPTAAPPVEARQPARAPECSASLDRMRHLANASTRSAIQVHQCRQISSSTLAAFLQAAAASLASSGLAVMGAATGSVWWQVGSLGLLVAALTLSWRFWSTSRKNFQDAL